MNDFSIVVELPDEEAQALAQFVKRVGWYEVRENAANEEEAHMMIASLNKLRRGLAEAGYCPR